MNPERPKKTSIHTRNISQNVKTQFKAYCAARGYTMEAAVIALLKKAARENMILPDARKRERNPHA